MKFTFAVPGERLPQWLDTLTNDYTKRLSFWIDTSIKLIRSLVADRKGATRKSAFEAEALSDFLKDGDYVISFDERGRKCDTAEFSRLFEKVLSSGKKRVVFIVGGSYGLTNDLKAQSDLLLSLSPLTMTHHLALAVAMEQVYRAMTILKGKTYHNE